MRRMMSIILFVLIIIPGIALAGDSPVGKGSIIVSGGFRFTSSGGDAYEDEDGKRSTSFAMDPGMSYFVAPGLAVGAKVIFETFSQGEYSSKDYGFGPQILYYIGGSKPPVQTKGATLPFGRVAFLYTKHDWETKNSDGGHSWMRWRFGGGVLHMLSNAVGIFAEGAYEFGTYEPKDGDSENGNRAMGIIGITHFIY